MYKDFWGISLLCDSVKQWIWTCIEAIKIVLPSLTHHELWLGVQSNICKYAMLGQSKYPLCTKFSVFMFMQEDICALDQTCNLYYLESLSLFHFL